MFMRRRGSRIVSKDLFYETPPAPPAQPESEPPKTCEVTQDNTIKNTSATREKHSSKQNITQNPEERKTTSPTGHIIMDKDILDQMTGGANATRCIGGEETKHEYTPPSITTPSGHRIVSKDVFYEPTSASTGGSEAPVTSTTTINETETFTPKTTTPTGHTIVSKDYIDKSYTTTTTTRNTRRKRSVRGTETNLRQEEKKEEPHESKSGKTTDVSAGGHGESTTISKSESEIVVDKNTKNVEPTFNAEIRLDEKGNIHVSGIPYHKLRNAVENLKEKYGSKYMGVANDGTMVVEGVVLAETAKGKLEPIPPPFEGAVWVALDPETGEILLTTSDRRTIDEWARANGINPIVTTGYKTQDGTFLVNVSVQKTDQGKQISGIPLDKLHEALEDAKQKYSKIWLITGDNGELYITGVPSKEYLQKQLQEKTKTMILDPYTGELIEVTGENVMSPEVRNGVPVNVYETEDGMILVNPTVTVAEDGTPVITGIPLDKLQELIQQLKEKYGNFKIEFTSDGKIRVIGTPMGGESQETVTLLPDGTPVHGSPDFVLNWNKFKTDIWRAKKDAENKEKGEAQKQEAPDQEAMRNAITAMMSRYAYIQPTETESIPEETVQAEGEIDQQQLQNLENTITGKGQVNLDVLAQQTNKFYPGAEYFLSDLLQNAEAGAPAFEKLAEFGYSRDLERQGHKALAFLTGMGEGFLNIYNPIFYAKLIGTLQDLAHKSAEERRKEIEKLKKQLDDIAQQSFDPEFKARLEIAKNALDNLEKPEYLSAALKLLVEGNVEGLKEAPASTLGAILGAILIPSLVKGGFRLGVEKVVESPREVEVITNEPREITVGKGSVEAQFEGRVVGETPSEGGALTSGELYAPDTIVKLTSEGKTGLLESTFTQRLESMSLDELAGTLTRKIREITIKEPGALKKLWNKIKSRLTGVSKEEKKAIVKEIVEELNLEDVLKNPEEHADIITQVLEKLANTPSEALTESQLKTIIEGAIENTIPIKKGGTVKMVSLPEKTIKTGIVETSIKGLKEMITEAKNINPVKRILRTKAGNILDQASQKLLKKLNTLKERVKNIEGVDQEKIAKYLESRREFYQRTLRSLWDDLQKIIENDKNDPSTILAADRARNILRRLGGDPALIDELLDLKDALSQYKELGENIKPALERAERILEKISNSVVDAMENEEITIDWMRTSESEGITGFKGEMTIGKERVPWKAKPSRPLDTDLYNDLFQEMGENLIEELGAEEGKGKSAPRAGSPEENVATGTAGAQEVPGGYGQALIQEVVDEGLSRLSETARELGLDAGRKVRVRVPGKASMRPALSIDYSRLALPSVSGALSGAMSGVGGEEETVQLVTPQDLFGQGTTEKQTTKPQGGVGAREKSIISINDVLGTLSTQELRELLKTKDVQDLRERLLEKLAPDVIQGLRLEEEQRTIIKPRGEAETTSKTLTEETTSTLPTTTITQERGLGEKTEPVTETATETTTVQEQSEETMPATYITEEEASLEEEGGLPEEEVAVKRTRRSRMRKRGAKKSGEQAGLEEGVSGEAWETLEI